MKNILSVSLFIVLGLCAFSCKNSGNTDASDNTSPAKDKPMANTKVVKELNRIIDSDSLLLSIKNMTKITPGEVELMIPAAEVIMEHRYKQTEKKSYIILDKDLWEYEFIFSGKSMSAVNQFAGCWIDFSDDLTYTYGRYVERQGSGKYAYSVESGLLLLIDDSSNVKPQEFEAKIFDQTLIMDGNDIYKDNNYNAKLKRITAIPKAN